jgi:hypothetical protein
MTLLVTGIELRGERDDPLPILARRLDLPVEAFRELEVVRRSIDARGRKPRWRVNCRVVLAGGEEAEERLLARGLPGMRRFLPRDAQRRDGASFELPPRRPWPESHRPVVVGAGPGGLFATLRLAEAGAAPLLLERGEAVEARTDSVHAFWRSANLNPESNVLFGEGGAGTFSDGKIFTRKRAGEIGYIFDRLVRFGASSDILGEAWPHLGTDALRRILPRIREHILHLGGEIRFGARVEALLLEGRQCQGVRLAGGERILHAPVILAIGHSARDTFVALIDQGLHAEPRPFAVGVRIEHAQAFIDRGRHHERAASLPHAAYRLAHSPPGGRGVRSFCMCPGGVVVAATHAEGHLALNGMSFSSRGSPWANAALIVDVDGRDFDMEDPLAGLRFQEALERRCFEAGGGAFRAPGQRVEDFLRRSASTSLGRSSYSLGVVAADLWDLLPEAVCEHLRLGLHRFDAEIPGFARDALLLAPESRTTSPLRFPRGPDRVSVDFEGLYPVGEGAGYAGGIVSAALDGFLSATAILERHGSA